MNIGISTDKKGIKVCNSFLDAEGFGVYDYKSKKIKIYSDNDLKFEFPGMTFSEIMTKLNIGVVISSNYTDMMLKLFKTLRIETMLSEGEILDENIKLFELNKLENAKYGITDNLGSCSSSSCSSCNSGTC